MVVCQDIVVSTSLPELSQLDLRTSAAFEAGSEDSDAVFRWLHALLAYQAFDRLETMPSSPSLEVACMVQPTGLRQVACILATHAQPKPPVLSIPDWALPVGRLPRVCALNLTASFIHSFVQGQKMTHRHAGTNC